MKKRFLKENTKNTLLILSVNIFAIMTLAFAVLSFKDIIRDDNAGVNTIYLGLAFISLGLTKFNGFFIAEKRVEKIRAITLLVYNVGISIFAFFAANDYRLFFIVSGLYVLSIIISRSFAFFIRRKRRDIVFNVICILFSFLLALGIFTSITPSVTPAVLIIVAVILITNSFAEIATLSFRRLKAKLLFDIIRKTYALETLFGLVTLTIASALIFPIFEPSFNTFADGLWYSFVTITTIGFGDLVVTTTVGKILTVLLGIYGIIAVAVVTSIIVNFYSATAAKREKENKEEIEEVVQEEIKNVKEELQQIEDNMPTQIETKEPVSQEPIEEKTEVKEKPVKKKENIKKK